MNSTVADCGDVITDSLSSYSESMNNESKQIELCHLYHVISFLTEL